MNENGLHELPERISTQARISPEFAPEALALEGYRSGRLSEAEVRRMLGFATRMQVHGFLKDHGVYLQFGEADLEQDIREIHRRPEVIRDA